jgi:hypothetical protein
MAGRLLRTVGYLSEIVVRCWPLGKSQETVLKEQSDRYGPVSDEGDSETRGTHGPTQGPDRR